MLRPLLAGALGLAIVATWLTWGGCRAQWQPDRIAASLADSAARWGLPGLSARGRLLAADLARRRLASPDDDAPESRRGLRAVITHRMVAARTLLDSGHPAAAEAVALDASRADFGDLSARALLLETRLQSPRATGARRELMLLLLQREHPAVVYTLGQALVASGQAGRGRGYLQRATELDPGHVPALLALARLAAAKGDGKTAARYLAAADAGADDLGERTMTARARTALEPGYKSYASLARVWWQGHWVTVVAALAYILLLFLPTWRARIGGKTA